MRRLMLLCLVLVHPHAVAAPAGALLLWPGAPPGGAAPGSQRDSAKGSITQVEQPYLIVHRPAQPNGTAILLVSGGGYAHIEAGKESGPAASWLQARGVTAFELVYRLPQEGGGVAAPFQDGQRAMRVIRARAAEWRIDPARIGMLGFSAGAHLAGMTTVQPDAALYAPVDAIDGVSARPDFAVLLYPVLTMQRPFDTTHAKQQLLGSHPTQAARDALSVELHVDARTPPMFIAQPLDAGALAAVLRRMVDSHADCGSTQARLALAFPVLRRQPALLTAGLSGWKSYPVRLQAHVSPQGFALTLTVEIGYSSTCPCSAALARQLLADAFAARFGAGGIDGAAARDWLREHASLATPHSQRSTATVSVALTEQAELDLFPLIDLVEAALATPLQTAVKRADEQAFARLNGANLMYVEDAARRVQAALAPRITGVTLCAGACYRTAYGKPASARCRGAGGPACLSFSLNFFTQLPWRKTACRRK